MKIPRSVVVARSRLIAACCSLLPLLLVAGTAGAGSYPRLFHANLVPNPGSASELARYDHVAYSYRAPLSTRQSVRALNPSSIDFGWISAISVPVTDSYGLMRAIRDSANAYNWWVYRTDGSHLLSWRADGVDNEWVLDMTDNCPRSPRGERFRDWYARTLVDSLVTRRQFRGILLDQCHTTIYWLRESYCNPGNIRIDLNRDGTGDADTTVTRQWALGMYDFMSQVRQRVGPNYPLICNGAVNLYYDNAGKRLTDFVNGNMFECFLYMPPLRTDFHNNLYNINRGYFPEEAATQFLNGQKWMIIADSGPCLGLTGSDLERQKRLTLGSCLLTDAFYTRPPWEGNEWQPEYDLCLGEPVSGLDSLGGGTQGVWVREFTSGFVAVNPNTVPVTVPGRGIVVPARDAVILVDPPDRVPALSLVTTSTNSIQVRFTVPGDPAGCGVPTAYRLRAKDPANTTREWNGAVTFPAGSSQSVTASGLAAATLYRLTLTTEISSGAPSAASDTLRVSTTGWADTQPPATVTDLAATDSTQSTLTVRWSAPSDPPSGAAANSYEMRRWPDGGSWSTGTTVGGVPSPATPGIQQSATATGLAAGTRYHFQIRSRDAAGNWSDLSTEAAARTLSAPDTQLPSTIANLAVVDSTQSTLTLRWTAPSDPPSSVAASAYELRRWTDGGSWNTGSAIAGLPVPASPGTQESVVVGSLSAATRYHFQIRSRDAANNWSALSNEAAARTMPAPDVQAPAAVVNLSVSDSTQTSLTLRWSAPSDPPSGAAASAYELRRWMDGGSWNAGTAITGLPVPSAPGTQQSAVVGSLSAGTRYHFQIRSRDAANNWSGPSNEAIARTLSPPDTLPPAAVADLAVADSTQTSLTLRWSAPSDPPSGVASFTYEMRHWSDGGSWNTGEIVAGLPTPSAPGTQQTVVVGSLTAGARHHFQIRSRDVAGNWSDLSAEATARTLSAPDTQLPSTIANLAVADSTQSTVTLQWSAPSDPPSGAAASAYELRRWTDNASWSAGTAVTGLPAPAAPGTQQTTIAGSLSAATRYHFQIRSRDASGNWSALSNEAIAHTLTAPDTQSPAAIANLSITDSTQSALTVRWNAPADPPLGIAATAYEMRLWDDEGSWSTGDVVHEVPAPAAPGTQQTTIAGSLSAATRYHFQIRSRDAAGNWSNLSNEASARTLPVPDTEPPSAIVDFAATDAAQTSLMLLWSAPADPPSGMAAASYDLRMWTAGGSWETATEAPAPSPAAPGAPQTIAVRGLEPATVYTFGIRSRDASGNVSAASNAAFLQTLDPPDVTPPARIEDLLAGEVSTTSIELRWTAPADLPRGTRVAGYECRYWQPDSLEAVHVLPAGEAAPPAEPGEPESRVIEGLAPGTRYEVSVTSFDESGNVSLPSGIVAAETLTLPDAEAPQPIADLVASALSHASARLVWTAPPDPPSGAAAAAYEIRRWGLGGS